MSEEQVGLREFNEHTSRYVHLVSESQQPIDITYHGKPVARLVPADDKEPPISPEQWLTEMEEIAQDVASVWPEGVSAVEAVREQRRDL